MKKRTIILLVTLAAILTAATLFLALQGVLAANKRQGYFDAYGEQAIAYAKASPELREAYGEDFTVTLDGNIAFGEEGRRPIDRYIEVFVPQVPDTIEEFAARTNYLKFSLFVNGDEYEIVFEKNDAGELAVSRLARNREE